MVFSTRVPADDPPDLVGRSPEDYARGLEDFLRRQAVIMRESIPAGFLATDPEPVTLAVGDVSPGAEASGWAAADHVHWVDLLLTAKGDSLTFDGADYIREAVGADNTILVAQAAQATGRYWRTVAQILELILLAKGDLLTYRAGSGIERKVVGADGLSLTADSVEANGLRYGPVVVRPAQITASQDNYNPGRFNVAFLDSDADWDITGLDATGAVDGETRIIWNIGAFQITLKHETTSTAGNRFTGQGAADITIKAGFSATIVRDGTTDRWRAREE